jgi:hypothetical protein
MVTVVREDGLRVVIYLNDHPPAHVHVFGDGEAKIDLLGRDRMPSLVWADDMTHGEVRRAMRLVAKYQAFLLARWEDIHGGAR